MLILIDSICKHFVLTQFPFGGDVSSLLPMRSSAGLDRRPEPYGRGGDFFYGGERMPPIRGRPHRGEKMYRPDFIELAG